ncbi:ATP-binding protein [Kitasatospora sp. NBC_00240]|uniref:ATP-binding protein n=1 Tax=Kitasatospora sp. NBC_00240 TaxID=2903567 RepID=UPI002252F4DF|nr:ATP-binding protein [Kitasatospora sp. NBC_00240]MCX5209008.1 ATP-binding protein [Kitasatospora sp. NBC_00240]
MTERRRPGGALSGPTGEGTARTGSAQADAPTPGRFPRPLACCLAVLSLSGCGAAADGSAVPALWGAGAAVVLAGGSAYVARRATARPLLRARDQAERNLRALMEERHGLAAEREAQDRRLQAYAGERQQLLHEREQLLRTLDELTRQAEETAERQSGTDTLVAELSAERDALTAARDALVRERDALAKEVDELEGSVDSTFVNLAMRTLTLVERQLVLIEALEGREADPAQLESLFRLDHLATRMRRNSENMLLLAGLENSHRSRKTVTLLDVVRAAVSEIERYERVKLGFLASIRLSGAVADDTSHLVAELLENATAFSPPQDQVEVGGWLLDNGELMISVVDRGIGLPGERLRALNEQLSEPSEPGSDRRDALLAGALTGRSMGLFVVARLARRHGIRVQLRENVQGGGVTAMVMLPREALQQDAVTNTDLDDQRRAERTVTSAAESARAQAEALAAEQARPATAAPRADGPAAGGELPVLPRRKPAAQAVPVLPAQAAEPGSQDVTGAGPVDAGPSAEQVVEQVVEPSAEQAAEPSARQAAEQAAEHGRTEERIPEQHLNGTRAPERGAVPEDAPVTPLGLPRRIPRGNGLPGTGEMPTSGLRRLAVEESAPARTAPAAADGSRGGTGQGLPGRPVANRPVANRPVSDHHVPDQHAPARSGVSPEELRRRLGVFQGGLRRAARDSAPTGPAGARPEQASAPTPAAAPRPTGDRPTEDRPTGDRPTEDRPVTAPPTTARPSAAPPTDRPSAPAAEQPVDAAVEGENR